MIFGDITMKQINKSNFKGYKFAGLILVISLLIFTACNTLQSKEGEKPTTKPSTETQKPAAPIVVDGVRTSYADIVEKTTPAVVQITAVNTTGKSKKANSRPSLEDLFRDRNQEQQSRPRRGFGSGVIVKDDGTILTNHHVIDEADKITVETSDNKSYEAKVVGSDPPSDLAVLKIEGEEFPFLKLGDSDEVRIGDIVLAIGNPLGIGQTVTSGIISAKGRRTGLGDGTSFQDFLQTDAPINQGNSGGALVNVQGELIGINSQILSRSGGSIGIGFAIPSNMADSVMQQLVENGKVRRGMLGVNIQNISSELAKTLELDEATGVIVSNVRKDSAAEKAGIERGDVIIKINDEKVEDGNFLRNKVASTKPGSNVVITVIRDKEEKEIKVTLDEFDIGNNKTEETNNSDSDKGESKQSGKLGLSLQPLTEELGKRLKVPTGVKGVVVTEVESGSPADEKGINKGDVIMEINRQMVESLDDVRSALEKSGDNSALLLISRQGQTLFITVKPRS